MNLSCSSHRSENPPQGLTLVEVLVAVVILGIAAAVAAPNLSMWLERYTLRNAGRQLVSDLQLAKMKAVSQGLQHRVSFDVAGKSYVIERGNSSSGSTTWVQVEPIRALASEQSPYYAKGVSFTTNLTNDRVIFSPVGNASPAGTVTLSTTNYQQLVTVVLTGRVRIE
ncbi:MAG: GspH/FimT family pseudopilin [candidate division WOR-3 bacterium]